MQNTLDFTAMNGEILQDAAGKTLHFKVSITKFFSHLALISDWKINTVCVSVSICSELLYPRQEIRKYG